MNEPLVYIAGPWSHKVLLQGVHDSFRNHYGILVASTWTKQAETSDPDTLRRCAKQDWVELVASDVLVLFNLAKSEGKACETGAALALGHRVILVGERAGNIFLHLPDVEQVQTMDEAAMRILRSEP